MKVKKIELGNEQKGYMTGRSFAKAKVFAKEMMKDNEGFQFEIMILENRFSGNCVSAFAEVVCNGRIWNHYNEESERLDVWFSLIIDSSILENKIYKIGCYLSDIWDINDSNFDEIKKEMYIREFSENR